MKDEDVQRLEEFLKEYCLENIINAIKEDKTSFELNFKDLEKFSPELADQILDNSSEFVDALKKIIEELPLPIKLKDPLEPRVTNISEAQKIMIRDIRSKHLKKMIWVEGFIRKTSDIRPVSTLLVYECPSCSTLIDVEQKEPYITKPSRCANCGRKGSFKMVDKKFVDTQRIVIEESPEELLGGEQPKRLTVFLEKDLVNQDFQKAVTPGNKVNIYGVVREVPIVLRTGGRSTTFDLVMWANNIIPIEQRYTDIKITKKDEKEIKRLSKDPETYEKLIQCIAPSISGHKKIKECVILQMFGGVKKQKADGTSVRGDIHVLLVGDPGTGKTQILRHVAKLSPKGGFVSGKGASAAGLSANITKDEFLNGWALEAGAMVLASGGILCLHPDTEVIFNNKITKMGELFDVKKAKIIKQGNEIIEYNELNGQVPNLNLKSLCVLNNNALKIRRKRYNGKLIKLNLKSGFSIKLTPDHKLLDGNDLEWKEAQNFSVNDMLIAPLKLPENNKESYILDILPEDWKVALNKKEKEEIKEWIKKDFKSLSEFNRKFNLHKNYLSGNNQFSIKTLKEILNYFGKYDERKSLPLKFFRKYKGERLKIAKITPELGYVLGFLYGDGNVKVSKRRTHISLIQSLKHKSYIDQFNKCWNSIFDKSIHSIDGKSESIIRGQQVTSNCRYMYYGSNLLGELYGIFVKNHLSNILNLDNETLKAFIAGVMDSDGCICTKKNKEYIAQHADFIFAPNKKEDNLNFIMALRRLDSYGKIIKQKDRYLVEITGRTDVKELKNKIEKYSIKAKETKILDRIISTSSISQKIPSIITANICNRISDLSNKSILVKEGLWSTVYNFKEKRIQPSRDQLVRIKSKLSLPQSLNEEIDRLLKRDYYLDEIVSIEEENYEGYVYDFSVPENNNFTANGIIVHNCIDELDKMNDNDRSAMHEALESQVISINKANIHATLKAETTVLAAANPVKGRFILSKSISDQIQLESTLINRFDCIYTIRDKPSKVGDRKIAEHVLRTHMKPEDIVPPIEADLLRKYIAYARTKCNPRISEESEKEIVDFYVNLRNCRQNEGEEEAWRPIPISARQLEALIRLAEAHARTRLAETVEKQDAEKAIELLTASMKEVGVDPETKEFDIDRIMTEHGTTASQRVTMSVKDIIDKLHTQNENILYEDIVGYAKEQGINEERAKDIINKMKREGDLFEPRHGVIKKVNKSS